MCRGDALDCGSALIHGGGSGVGLLAGVWRGWGWGGQAIILLKERGVIKQILRKYKVGAEGLVDCELPSPVGNDVMEINLKWREVVGLVMLIGIILSVGCAIDAVPPSPPLPLSSCPSPCQPRSRKGGQASRRALPGKPWGKRCSAPGRWLCL
jgi:hypothetical protein